MADDRFCRFATKLVIDGVTHIDGILSGPLFSIAVNSIMAENGLPVFNWSDLHRYAEGAALTYDITFNGHFIVFELTALSGPVKRQAVVENRPPSE